MVKIEKKQRVLSLLLGAIMTSEGGVCAMAPEPVGRHAFWAQNVSSAGKAFLATQVSLAQCAPLEEAAAFDDRLLKGADAAMKKYPIKKKPRAVSEAYLFDALEMQIARDEDSFFFAQGFGEVPTYDDLEPCTWWQVFLVIEPILRDYIPDCFAYIDKEAFKWQINRLLLYGAGFNNKELVAVAICAGADKNIRNKWGYSALDIARTERYPEIMEMLEVAQLFPSDIRFTLENDGLEGDNYSYGTSQEGDGYCTVADFEGAVQEDDGCCTGTGSEDGGFEEFDIG